MARDETAVRCRSVVRVYDSPSGRVQAVRGLDLDVPRASLTAIVGPSGSGKSSLLRIIAGLDRPTAGDVSVGDEHLSNLSDRRLRRLRHRLVSNIYQSPGDNLLPGQTALQQVRRAAVRRNAAPDAAEEMLVRLGLGERLHHRPDELSGGEQQRVAFARGAVGDPAVVIADEPTAELDSVSSGAVIDAMRTLAEHGTTIIVATHDPLVMEQAEHVVMLRDGTIASVLSDSGEMVVIDQSGRVQLPPAVRSWFPGDRAVLRVDEQSRRIWIESP